MFATESKSAFSIITAMPHQDNLLFPIKTNEENLSAVIKTVLDFADGENINLDNWANGRYSPTPTIIEAAMSLYNGHGVEEIARTDASAINLSDNNRCSFEYH